MSEESRKLRVLPNPNALRDVARSQPDLVEVKSVARSQLVADLRSRGVSRRQALQSSALSLAGATAAMACSDDQVFCISLAIPSALHCSYDTFVHREPFNRVCDERRICGDSDIISVHSEFAPDLGPNQVEIGLRSAEAISWWKSVLVFDRVRWRVISEVSTYNDRHGPYTMRIDLDGRNPSKLEVLFLKAKFLGLHTGMYWLTMNELNYGQFRGMRFIFGWEREG